MRKLGMLVLALALLAVSVAPVKSQEEIQTGNVIFFHPDGSGLNHWNAARMYWYGPDGALHWDGLPEMAVYRGHMSDRLVGTSNGGATVHAFGYKVLGPGSFGQDGGIDPDEPGSDGRPIQALSGYPGSLLREAAAAGMPIGIVNDGDLPEPGTGAFLAEVGDRNLSNEIARQFLDGRPGFEGEPLPKVMLGGGEAFFLPADAPACDDEITLECYVHVDQVNGRGPARDDGRNLLQEAAELGYEVIRTRAEFDALWGRIQAEPDYAPMVLGLFARDDIFNDTTEERLIARGLVDDAMADTKEGRLIIWGSRPDTPGYNPPTPAEMTQMALELLRRHSEAAGQPFFLVTEVESTDNLANNANAIGTLRALKAADDAIGVIRQFIAENPNTLLLTAADSDAGGLQVFSPAPVDGSGLVTTSGGNPTGIGLDQGFPLDGVEGQHTAPFVAAPDAFGNELDFAIGWSGTNDVAGAILSRAEGLNAELLRTHFSGQFDSTDVYRLMYATLFGELLPPAYGQQAPDRGE
ncbi:alkaline phosphatase [Litorilinea aerophila]|uniref:alkaline phosphatase n=1 Tax=Litorilinea aerophila TaxID=1204385 RepID=UPI001E501D96|nr:alkaline phosphatase [Litorilinea aerophila]MCC9074926.1 alkaline phosphatase [Litorilinea aerophila]